MGNAKAAVIQALAAQREKQPTAEQLWLQKWLNTTIVPNKMPSKTPQSGPFVRG